MRACTLATLELVTTLPETVSPGCTVVSLTATARICGAALGGKRDTLAESLGSVTAGDGSAVEAVAEAEGDGAAGEADALVPGPAVAPARGEAAACVRVLGVGDGPAPPECAAWLQPANQSRAAPTPRAERTLGMHASSWTLYAFRSG
jgi:hypothetical protein